MISSARQKQSNKSLDENNNREFYRILQMDSPKDILVEVQSILGNVSPKINIASVTYAFLTTINLFQGRYAGYLACNTNYHDMRHTVETFLAAARLIDGAVLDGERFDAHNIVVGLKAALFHDSGYIQEHDDKEGTGAKYTANHVHRSMDFFERHKAELGLSDSDAAAGQAMILCTQLDENIGNIYFPSKDIEVLGRILAVADLLAQMADRIYLEKLLLLYDEFEEGNIGNYENEEDLLRKTLSFFDFVSERINKTLEKSQLYMRLHFETRWNLCENLYTVSFNKQKSYLEKIIASSNGNLIKHLKRGGLANDIHQKKQLVKNHFNEN